MEDPLASAFVLTLFGIILASFTLPNSYFPLQLSFPSPVSCPGQFTGSNGVWATQWSLVFICSF